MSGRNAVLLSVSFLISPTLVGGVILDFSGEDIGPTYDEVTMVQASVKTSPVHHMTKKRPHGVKEAQASHDVVPSQSFQKQFIYTQLTAAPAYAVILLTIVTLLVAGLKATKEQGWQPQQPQTKEVAPPPRANDHWAVTSESVESKGLPAPTHAARLNNISATFVVPIKTIGHCRANELIFDIPAVPAACSYHAVFSRSGAEIGWEKIELSSMANLAGNQVSPQLMLTCQRHADNSAETDFPCAEAADSSQGQTSECPTHEDGAPWLKIVANDDTVVAVIVRRQDNSVSFWKPGQAQWDIETRLEHGNRGINIFQDGQEIGRATGLDRGRHVATGRMDFLQVDTQLEARSRDAGLLLMCMLAMNTFKQQA